MTKLILSALTAIFISAVCFGQRTPPVEEENWLRGFNSEADYDPTLVYWATPFSTEDLANGKRRLKSIRESAPENEWEGVYYGLAAIGDDRLIWNEKSGFFRFYFYHALRYIDYGTAKNTSEAVSFISEKPLEKRKTESAPQTFIKVRFGERIYLVPENKLRIFCETAAGVNTENDADYWEKEETRQKKVFGLPIVPGKYENFVRLPIEIKITGVGKRTFDREKLSGDEYSLNAVSYLVKLNAGRNKKLKVGMNFYVEDLGEWIDITKVSQNNAVGRITRDFDENKREKCRDTEDGTGEYTPCKTIKAGMNAKTKTSENYF